MKRSLKCCWRAGLLMGIAALLAVGAAPARADIVLELQDSSPSPSTNGVYTFTYDVFLTPGSQFVRSSGTVDNSTGNLFTVFDVQAYQGSPARWIANQTAAQGSGVTLNPSTSDQLLLIGTAQFDSTSPAGATYMFFATGTPMYTLNTDNGSGVNDPGTTPSPGPMVNPAETLLPEPATLGGALSGLLLLGLGGFRRPRRS